LDFTGVLIHPDPGIPAITDFSRWTHFILPRRAVSFTNHDDGARLFVDNILDQCLGHLLPVETVDISLSGNRTIKMEMFENGGAVDRCIVVGKIDISGWRSEYFNNGSLSDHPVLVRDDRKTSILIGWTSLLILIQVGITFPRGRTLSFSSGSYTFDIFHDDGARLYIDGILNWITGAMIAALTDSITRDY
jgi:hypothetical protein